MKLATLPDEARADDARHGGRRDGRLVVVSRDLALCADADDIAPNLQAALEDWKGTRPKLLALSDALNAGRVGAAVPFDPAKALSPLPRAYQWLDASAFLSHGALMQKVFNLAADPQADAHPLMYQGASDDFLAPTQDAPFLHEEDGIDLEAEFAVVLDETPMGVEGEDALAAVCLVMLVNDWSLRAYAPREMKSGFGFLQAKPATAFGPVAVTPDELGDAWADGRIKRPVIVTVRGETLGRPHGAGMSYTIADLVAHAARTRRLRAGTILGFGTVSNFDADTVGSACLAERRALDMIAGRKPTPFLRFGDQVRIEAFDAQGQSIFGAIDQRVVKAGL